MANHAATKKDMRQNAKRNERNRYYGKTTRNALRKYLGLSDAAEAEKTMGNVVSLVDKLAKRNQIHDNKAGHLKSQVMLHMNSLKK